MWFTATINAFDAIDRVHVAATVRVTRGELGDPLAEVYSAVASLPGVGEDDPRQWLVDALTGLLEEI